MPFLQRFNTVALAALSFLLFASHDAASKWLGTSIGFGEAAFLIQISLVLLIIGKQAAQRHLNDILPLNKSHVAIYGVLQTLLMMGFYFALTRIPLVDLFVIVLLRPVVSAVLAHFILREAISRLQISALLAGLAAVFVTFRVWDGAFANAVDMLGFCGAIGNVFASSLRYIWVRKVAHRENVLCLTFWSSLALAGVGLLFAAPAIPMPSIADVGFAVGAGLFFLTGSILLLDANQRGPVASVAATQYSMLLWMALYGWLLFNEIPSHWSMLGLLLSLVSGALLYVESRRKL